MKFEECTLYGFLDHPDDSSSDTESIDGEDVPIHHVHENMIGDSSGQIGHIGGVSVAGQNLVITESVDGSEILIFFENDPALHELIAKRNGSVNGIENGVCNVSLGEEDSKQQDNISPDEDDSKQKDISSNEKDSEQEDRASPNVDDLNQKDM